ncbi:MAG TPA: hypothetical protein VM240_13630 [Verrucomicrobiae bacterium]|nr:hypothetical protein [Verrucomicrobiae bacterium]
MKLRFVIALAGLVAVGAAGWLLRPAREAPIAGADPAIDAIPASATLSPMPPVRTTSPALGNFPLAQADRDFVAALRAKFGPHLADRHARIKAIEQVVAYLQQQYPDDWRERVRALLAELAPGLADALVAAFDGLMRLNEWLAVNREALLRMSPDERRAALWAARREAFGADAEAIYAGEVRSEKLADALKSLDVAQGPTLDEKLTQLVSAVEIAWGAEASAFMDARGTELINRFLDVPSVQDELRAMGPADRNAALRRVREGMGLDESALARWDTLDRERDQVWTAGRQYAREREQILAQHSGAERDRRLAELQQRTFGAEADTIREEEAAGFYRYGGERRIGRE